MKEVNVYPDKLSVIFNLIFSVGLLFGGIWLIPSSFSFAMFLAVLFGGWLGMGSWR